MLEAIGKFATESPRTAKFLKLMLATAAGFAAKEGTEKLLDKVLESAKDATSE